MVIWQQRNEAHNTGPTYDKGERMRKNVRQELTALQKQRAERNKLEPPHKDNVRQKQQKILKRKAPKRVKTGVRSQAQRSWLANNLPNVLSQLEQEQQPLSVVARVKPKTTTRTRRKVSPLDNPSRHRLSGKSNSRIA